MFAHRVLPYAMIPRRISVQSGVGKSKRAVYQRLSRAINVIEIKGAIPASEYFIIQSSRYNSCCEFAGYDGDLHGVRHTAITRESK